MFVDSVEKFHQRLREYIEAVYHVADAGILDQREALLNADGVLRQPAFIESTRSYAAGPRYQELLSAAPPAVLELARRLSTREPRLLHDPPYEHQGEALRALLFDAKDIVVYTGTGSGKTECFTVPILMRLLSEAVASRASFEQRAVRALVLYPMNALVNDQLGRVRKLLGDDEVAEAFELHAGRPATMPLEGLQFTALGRRDAPVQTALLLRRHTRPGFSASGTSGPRARSSRPARRR